MLSIIFSVDLEEALRMSAGRADLGRLGADDDMTAVAAFPNFDFGLCKHFRKLDVLEQRAIALFVMLFDGGDEAELCGKFGKPSFSAVSANSLYISVHS